MIDFQLDEDPSAPMDQLQLGTWLLINVAVLSFWFKIAIEVII